MKTNKKQKSLQALREKLPAVRIAPKQSRALTGGANPWLEGEGD